MKACQECGGKSKKKVRQYRLINLILNMRVASLWLCDSCVFPLLYEQAKAFGG